MVENFEYLEKRREQARLTLNHLKKEKAEVERNTEWLNQAAYQSRVKLLGRLSDWYSTEIEEIEKVLRPIEREN